MVITPPPEPRTFKLVLGWKDHSDRGTRGRVLLKHRVIEHGLRRRGLVLSQLLGALRQGLARRMCRIDRVWRQGQVAKSRCEFPVKPREFLKYVRLD